MDITGIMIYYYFMCKRKLWYYVNNLNMEQNSELVKIGKIIDENTFKKEKKSLLIDNTINIDFIRNDLVIYEIKKSKSIEDAECWQLKYYMYYLKNKGVVNVKGRIDFPTIKESKEIILERDDIPILEKAIADIQRIVKQDKPSEKLENKICKKCAYYDLCYI